MQSLTRIINAISNGINAICRVWNLVRDLFKAAPKAEPKAEAQAPVEVEETNETEPADVIEPDNETVDVQQPPVMRGVAMEFFAATMSNQNAYAFPTPRNDDEIRTLNRLLAKVNLTTKTWIDPKTFCADAHAFYKQCVLNANGYSVELAIVLDYVMAGQLKAACSYFRLHTGTTLMDALGQGGYRELVAWARKAENLTLEGNLVRINAYAQHPSLKEYIESDYTLQKLSDAVDAASLSSRVDTQPLVDSMFHLSKYCDATSVQPLILLSRIRKGGAGKAAAAFKTAGIRDGGLTTLHGPTIGRMSAEAVTGLLVVLGRFNPANQRQVAVIEKYTTNK
jgi:hypothetical protein